MSRRLGIPSSTIRLWRRTPSKPAPRVPIGPGWRPGCDKTYRYALGLYLGDGHIAAPRGYFFSNLSGDIRRIFTDHCEQLGIRWTQSNPRNVSISHRTSVALRDEFVGSKA